MIENDENKGNNENMCELLFLLASIISSLFISIIISGSCLSFFTFISFSRLKYIIIMFNYNDHFIFAWIACFISKKKREKNENET